MESPLVVVTGPPGVGKSTVAALVADRFTPSVLVDGDAFFGFLRSGAVEPWLPAARDQNEVVTEGAAAAAGRYARGGYTTVYDGVLGPWFLPTFAAAAGVPSLHYVMLMAPVEVCVERVATRVGHGFTDEPATRKMHSEFARAELDPRHVVADVSGSVDSVVAGVLQLVESGAAIVFSNQYEA